MLLTEDSADNIGYLSKSFNDGYLQHEYNSKLGKIDSIMCELQKIAIELFFNYPKHKSHDNTSLSSDCILSLYLNKAIETFTSIIILNRIGLFSQSAMLSRSIYEQWITLSYIALDKETNYSKLINSHKHSVNEYHRKLSNELSIRNIHHNYTTHNIDGNRLPNTYDMCKALDSNMNSDHFSVGYRKFYPIACDYAHTGLINIGQSLNDNTIQMCDNKIDKNRFDIHISTNNITITFCSFIELMFLFHEPTDKNSIMSKLSNIKSMIIHPHAVANA